MIGRRTLLRSLPASLAVLGGCLGSQGTGGFGTDDGSGGDGADDDASPEGTEILSPAIQRLRQGFERQDLSVRGVSVDDERVVVTVQTSGQIGEDMRRAAGVYASLAGNLERDLRVRVEDRGLVETTFEIRREWGRAFAAEDLSDQSYLQRINGTRESR